VPTAGARPQAVHNETNPNPNPNIECGHKSVDSYRAMWTRRRLEAHLYRGNSGDGDSSHCK